MLISSSLSHALPCVSLKAKGQQRNILLHMIFPKVMESGNCERGLSGPDIHIISFKFFSIQNKTLYLCLLYVISYSYIDIISNRNPKIINVLAVIPTHRNFVSAGRKNQGCV
jgi:hypothetical protein